MNLTLVAAEVTRRTTLAAVPPPDVGGYGRWGFSFALKRCLLWLAAGFVALSTPSAPAATVAEAEYFIDADPGPGNGVVVPASSPGATNAFTIEIPPSVIAALSAGVHTLACRVRDSEGKWSIAFSRTFFKESTVPIDSALPTVSIHPVTPNPRNSGIAALHIVFNKPVSGLDLADLALTRNGGANLLTAAQTVTSVDNNTFTLDSLAALTGIEGNYELTLRAAASGIIDSTGNRLSSDAGTTWAVDRTPPTARIVSVAPEPRNAATVITLIFNEKVTGLDLADLSLSRDGGANLLTALQTLSTSDQTTFILSGLTQLAGLDGRYTLALRAADSGIADLAGNPLTADVAESWTIDRTPPEVRFASVSPDPRNNTVASLTIAFSELVAGLDLTDLSLARNAGSNLLGGEAVLNSNDGTTFILEGLTALTALDGTYTAGLRAAGSGIADLAGNPLVMDAFEAWVVDSTPPRVSISSVTPDPRNSAVDGFSIVFSERVSGFNLTDLVLSRDGGANLLTGVEALTTADNRGFTLSGLAGLTAIEGSYVLALRAANSGIGDEIGNSLSADASVQWRVDRTPPTVQITAASDTAVITFSEPVMGFDPRDLVLKRGSGTNLLSGFEILVNTGNVTFVLHGIDALAAAEGAYTLALEPSGSGIIDAAGNALTGGASATWTTTPAVTEAAGAAEYFIDVDPGPGRGTPVSLAASTWPLALSVEIPPTVIAALPDGPHFLACRVRDSAGQWSIAFTRTFHKADPVIEPPAVVEFIEMQWFLNGAPASPPVLARVSSPARQVSLELEASIAGLTQTGTYQFLVTPVDSRGNRGVGVSRPVLIDPSTLPRAVTLGALRRLPDGSLQLTFSGDPGSGYMLQASPDLVLWIDRQPVEPGGAIQITGGSAATPQQFFRLQKR